MPRSAQELLAPDCCDQPSWARFDAAWYVAAYPEAAAAPLAYYFNIGAGLGHSPSPLFDEVFYLDSNPEIAELVAAGHYASGFDHFCRHGYRGLSPHWLFDDALYARLYDDMRIENLDLHGVYGRYDHYLKTGQHEGRIGHYLFDPAYAGAAGGSGGGPYTQFLYHLQSAAPERPPSVYFDPVWYRQQVPQSRSCRSALQHYLCREIAPAPDPVPQFSEAYYCAANRDVAAALEAGTWRNGYDHFLRHGVFELRRPRAEIDLEYYRNENPEVREALNQGTARDAFAHLRAAGLPSGLAFRPADAASITEAETKQLFIRKATQALALLATCPLQFAPRGRPLVAVIVVAFNQFALTMQTLSSLRDNYAGAIELIVVDNASTDETRLIEHYVRGACILRQSENSGFVRACTLALAHVTAPALLFLNNDVELGHGALAQALARLGSSPEIGAVGGKIIRTNGALQEAGCIVWQDGHTQGYLRDASPLAGEANFTRDVDFCSAAFLLCRTGLVQQLGGFDQAFAPAYYEDADLCIRIAAAGYRIVYDPLVVVHHLEFGSAAHADEALAQMQRSHLVFREKHQAYLAGKYPSTPGNLIRARTPQPQKRVLFIEDTIPRRRLGSGFVRATDTVHALTQAGWAVTVFPVNGAPVPDHSMFDDLPASAEVLPELHIIDLDTLLSQRPGYYHLVWVSRTHNLARVAPILASHGKFPIILDTEAIVSNRAAAAAALQGRSFDLPAAIQAEFTHAPLCHAVTAVNHAERTQLAALGLPALHLGTMCRPAPTTSGFAARHGLLFVASIHRADSPNLDALTWYADEILPALRHEMPDPPPLTVAGYVAPEIDLSRFAQHPHIRIHGPFTDPRPLYEAHRLFIAPTRYAAGTPYKIYEAAGFGLPCIVTHLLAGQLGWQNHIASAPVHDAPQFAAQIARAYRSQPLWQTLRRRALARLAQHHTPEIFQAEIETALASLHLPHPLQTNRLDPVTRTKLEHSTS